jgi:DNA replication and repair protein RecF
VGLRRLRVTDFRCLPTAELVLDPEFTLISGPNASGKTSLLEAIYLLGRGRSFRSRRVDQMIRTGCDRFIVLGEIDSASRRVPVGIEGTTDGVHARIDGEAARSFAELALALPVQVIDPEVHKLIEDGPVRRRRFLDWGVFHVEPDFLGHWQRFHHVLRQRNAALRARQPRAQVLAWDGDLTRYGRLVSEARERYVALLSGEVSSIGRRLLGQDLALGYRLGWARDTELPMALHASLTMDQERGFTQVGPQRADLTISMNGTGARDHISRGQQKLVAAALLLAQIRLYPTDARARPTLLLDDPAAELDDQRLHGLIQEVTAQSVQLVITTLHAEFPAFGAPGQRYDLTSGAPLRI